MKKLFASDFDNTLFFHSVREDGSPDFARSGFRQEDLEAIRKFQEEGNLFGICTGRSYRSILEEIRKEPLLHPDFLIAASGSGLYDGKGNPIDVRYLPLSVLEQFHALTGGDYMFIHKDDRYWSLSDRRLPFQCLLPQERNAILDDFRDYPVDTFSYEGMDAQEMKELEEKIQPYLHLVSCFVNEPSSIDFTAPGCSKGTGLLKAAAHFGIPPEHTGAIGDSFNDLPMLESAACAFTFPQADTRVREQADEVVTGIAQALERFAQAEKGQSCHF